MMYLEVLLIVPLFFLIILEKKQPINLKCRRERPSTEPFIKGLGQKNISLPAVRVTYLPKEITPPQKYKIGERSK